ncbi:MAG TPA: BON domain-containing protein [Candidatus Limnocylindrales bacterium]|nr:BON domain-containing protein [Candidatus Limnocylindrales bacterium]
MSDPRRLPDDRPNSGSMPLVDQLRALEGEEAPEDQDAVLAPDEMESEPRGLTDTERYLGDLEAGVPPDRDAQAGEIESLEGLADTDLRAGETDNAYVASDEGMPWIPPIDPPTVPTEDPQGVEVAAGTGVSANEEPYDDAHHGAGIPDDLEMTARVREALRADSATSALADRVEIVTRGATIVLRGPVDGIEDGDALVAVAARVTGVAEVRDETEVPGL